MKIRDALTALALFAAAAPCAGQQAVSVGKGSYAASPPNGMNAGIDSKQLHIVNLGDRPVPSNQYWTQLVVSQFAKTLWTYPLRIDPSQKGLEIYYPTKWSHAGNDPACDNPLVISGSDFHPNESPAKDWSDWLMSFRLRESDNKYMDVTLGEGMPYAWIECKGVAPVIGLRGPPAKFFGLGGGAVNLPATGDSLGIEFGGRNYGIFAPDGTTFTGSAGQVGVSFSGARQYLVVCPLPAPKDLDYFHKYAYAIPRNTQLSYTWDPVKGYVNTTWSVTTEVMKGTERAIIQGWIPHHYRQTVNDLQFNDLAYLTPRGPMKCSVGNEFRISFPFDGILPNLPAPKQIGGAHDYEPSRMHNYLAQLAHKPSFGDDTYWGGKDILRYGQCALMAQQIDDDNYNTFVNELHKAMANWYTYTPGERSHYFAYYPHWKALVGMKTSYGSESFNDHHFHYGYFTFATALLGMHDPEFVADYGEMAALVAKEYANYDRTDKRFPLFRCFDIWQGHGWAGGTSSPGGENEESSSEDAQSWAGMLYLGQVLGDDAMTQAAMMGYAMESQSIAEYWFNRGGDVFPPQWPHPVTGMVWSGGKVYGTYFSGDPAWVYAIQWLPASPMLSYLVRDPAFAKNSYENMCIDYRAKQKKEPTLQNFGSGLAHVMLGYVLMYDPQWAAEQMDDVVNDPKLNAASEIAVMYYQAHAMRNIGLVDWSVHGTSPTFDGFPEGSHQDAHLRGVEPDNEGGDGQVL